MIWNLKLEIYLGQFISLYSEFFLSIEASFSQLVQVYQMNHPLLENLKSLHMILNLELEINLWWFESPGPEENPLRHMRRISHKEIGRKVHSRLYIHPEYNPLIYIFYIIFYYSYIIVIITSDVHYRVQTTLSLYLWY